MCPGITGEGMAGRFQMVMGKPGAGQAEYTLLLVTPGLASAPTQEKKRNPPGSNNANMGSGEMLDDGGQAGRQTDDSPSPAAVPGCSSPHVTREHWLSPPSSSSPGDTHGHVALLQGDKAMPQGPCKGLHFTKLPPTELLLCKTFLPRN